MLDDSESGDYDTLLANNTLSSTFNHLYSSYDNNAWVNAMVDTIRSTLILQHKNNEQITEGTAIYKQQAPTNLLQCNLTWRQSTMTKLAAQIAKKAMRMLLTSSGTNHVLVPTSYHGAPAKGIDDIRAHNILTRSQAKRDQPSPIHQISSVSSCIKIQLYYIAVHGCECCISLPYYTNHLLLALKYASIVHYNQVGYRVHVLNENSSNMNSRNSKKCWLSITSTWKITTRIDDSSSTMITVRITHVRVFNNDDSKSPFLSPRCLNKHLLHQYAAHT